MHEALYYTSASDNTIQCRLCPHRCKISPSQTGFCRVRENIDGKLYASTYAKVSSINLDPIEKKPLFHFYPGKKILSIGQVGCNFHCSFCQNYRISQCRPTDFFWLKEYNIEDLVEQAAGIPSNIGLAYTYNEPFIAYEYLLDLSIANHAQRLKNVVVSNGFINKIPLRKLLPHVDAFNIDLKAFNDRFYRVQTQGRLAPVLQTIEAIAHSNAHLEITCLIIPGLNDSSKEFDLMLDWIINHIGENIPLHLSRYFPSFRMKQEATPETTLLQLYYHAKKRIRHVFLGNLFTADKANTFCPACGYEVISRNRHKINVSGLSPDGFCTFCHHPVLLHP